MVQVRLEERINNFPGDILEISASKKPLMINRRTSSSPDSSEDSNVGASDVLDESLLTSNQSAQSGVDLRVQNGSPEQSPSLQTMDRSEGYDPDRIPASVFASKPETPMEWSTASCESLFSIHVGNPSFTMEFAQFDKSGEFNKSQELVSPSGLLPVTEAADMERGSEVRETSFGNTKGASWPNEGDHGNDKMPPAEEFRDSSCSLDSSDSTLSFAFPVLEANGGRSSSIDVFTEKPQQEQEKPQPQKEPQPVSNAPEATQKAAGTLWVPCFSSCSCL